MHCANAYNLPKRLRARGRVARTNSTSNTAFRGFGAPQGMVAFEAAVEQAAAALGVAPELLREGSLVRRGGGEVKGGSSRAGAAIAPGSSHLMQGGRRGW